MELDHVELDELRIRPSGNRPTDNLPIEQVLGPGIFVFRQQSGFWAKLAKNVCAPENVQVQYAYD